ncbi:MAG TPA: hypothetical protein VFB23_05480 [Candidatus Acidoferrales bacterium]|nr:hypothetical protein [Candidatus Acidoferrales bacterium]
MGIITPETSRHDQQHHFGRLERLRRNVFSISGAGMVVLTMILVCSAGAKAQNPELPDQGPLQQTGEASGKAGGHYTTQQTIEFGYRDSMINGNLTNYNMFQDYASGWRLFDYDLNIHSANHQGLLFDDLTFGNFGYGGDPVSVSRLRVDKNKWYDFRASFRRDDYLFNYNLLGNPLNTTTFSTPIPITTSPNASQFVRHMQDYDLLLLPESRLRFRFGYSRISTKAPGSTGYEPTAAVVSSDLVGTSNEYRMGVDYRGLPRTTLSFDELLNYTRVDTSLASRDFAFQLANGTPVNLGAVFQGTTPCASPVINSATIPPTVASNCTGILSYSLIGAPRAKFPVERFSFQSDYFKNFTMSGSAAYSESSNVMTDLNEMFNGWISRTVTRASTTAGPAAAKRVVADVNWAGEYHITDKLSLRDEFYYHNWRIPSAWLTTQTNLFATKAGLGQSGLTLPISPATAANIATVCPAPFTAVNCPQHNTSSGPDVLSEAVSQFLGQDLKNNLLEVKYDFTKRVSAYIGYFYQTRTIDDFAATSDIGEMYFPGGATATAANRFLAARADCAVAAGALPSDCSLDPVTGVITEVGPEATNDTARNYYHIRENAAEFGVAARPKDNLRINADFMAGYNDNSFTRISPRQLQSYKVRATYEPKPWANVTASVDINENRDNVYTVNNLEHGRTYSLSTALSPRSDFTVDLGYGYMDVYTQTEICFPDSSILFTQPCPVAGSPSPLGTLSFYASRDNYAYTDIMFKPHKRITALVGYSGSIVRGSTTFLNPLSPAGTLDFNYLMPYASLTLDVYKGISYRTAWNYYGYQNYGIENPAGLAPLASQNFNGNNVTFVLRYAF